MEHMKHILHTLVLLAIVLVGCTNKDKKALPGRVPMVTAPSTDTIIARQTISSYKDPCVYGGSNILQYLLALLRTQDYNDAVDKITSKTSIKKYGRAKVLEFYKSINIDYAPVLLSVLRHGDSATLRYRVRVMATSRYVDVYTVVEDDTARIIFPDTLKI